MKEIVTEIDLENCYLQIACFCKMPCFLHLLSCALGVITPVAWQPVVLNEQLSS